MGIARVEIPRHAAVNETIRRALVSGSVPAVLEPVGVCVTVVMMVRGQMACH